MVTAKNRRGFLFGVGAVVLGGGYSVIHLTEGFGLLPTEYDASPVFVDNGLAIRGYDPVAYFSEGEPVLGKQKYRHDWNGATWSFASASNRDAFAADPEAYAPQYGGFCAWAVAAKSKLYSTQASNWMIVDGKLYLNYSDAVQDKWEQDIPGFIAEGNKRWPEVISAT